MAPRKRSRQDSAAASSAPAARTSRINETHAAELARHLAGLRKLRRFTDLKVESSRASPEPSIDTAAATTEWSA